MPSDRTGSAAVGRDKLKRVFDPVVGDPVVGTVRGAPVPLRTVRQWIDALDHPIFVQAQTLGSELLFILHFVDADPGSRHREQWLCIGSDFVGFRDLKSAFEQWMIDRNR